jgi:hypothetical protein
MSPSSSSVTGNHLAIIYVSSPPSSVMRPPPAPVRQPLCGRHQLTTIIVVRLLPPSPTASPPASPRRVANCFFVVMAAVNHLCDHRHRHHLCSRHLWYHLAAIIYEAATGITSPLLHVRSPPLLSPRHALW